MTFLMQHWQKQRRQKKTKLGVKLSDFGEFGFINRISQHYPSKRASVLRGIGDDAAVLALSENSALLLSTDQLIEGYHFRLDMTTGWDLGWKSLAVNLSDIAAMGGAPLGFTVSLGIPAQRISVEFLDDFYEGATTLGNTFGAELLGGDTSQAGERLIIGVSIIGEAAKDKVVYRNRGKDGDILYVTGSLGNAALGLKLLERGINRKEIQDVLKPYLRPTPRVREGQLLAERSIAHAMIDISDGLLADLYHLVQQSGTGGVIDLPLVPLSAELKDRALRHGLDPLSLALGGGDDYELLFCVSPEKAKTMEQLQDELTCSVTRIGELSSEVDGIMVKDENGSTRKAQPLGYDHFRTT